MGIGFVAAAVSAPLMMGGAGVSLSGELFTPGRIPAAHQPCGPVSESFDVGSDSVGVLPTPDGRVMVQLYGVLEASSPCENWNFGAGTIVTPSTILGAQPLGGDLIYCNNPTGTYRRRYSHLQIRVNLDCTHYSAQGPVGDVAAHDTLKIDCTAVPTNGNGLTKGVKEAVLECVWNARRS
jgi:hypothetical protein